MGLERPRGDVRRRPGRPADVWQFGGADLAHLTFGRTDDSLAGVTARSDPKTPSRNDQNVRPVGAVAGVTG